jgi:hypothetical protein
MEYREINPSMGDLLLRRTFGAIRTPSNVSKYSSYHPALKALLTIHNPQSLQLSNIKQFRYKVAVSAVKAV